MAVGVFIIIVFVEGVKELLTTQDQF